MYISIRIAFMLFFLSLICGILLLIILALLCFKKSAQVELINPYEASKEIAIKVITNQDIGRFTESKVRVPMKKNNKIWIDKKLDLSHINSKFMNKNANSPLFTNYLLKSKRSFLGY